MELDFFLKKNKNYDHESIYFTPEYQNIWADYDGAKPLVLGAQFSIGPVECPVLIKPLGNGFSEAYSAYGYGGFLSPGKEAWSKNRPILKEVFPRLIEYLNREKIISLFIRNMPYENNETAFPDQFLEYNRETVSVDLKEWQEEFPASFSSKERWPVRFARRNNVTVAVKNGGQIGEKEIMDFISLYIMTMDRNGAKDYYRLPKAVFLDHLKLGERLELIEAYKDGRMVGGSFFLLDPSRVHYHLSAIDAEYAHFQISDMMLHSAITRYARQGKKHLHLGGGRTAARDDSLLRFKKRFGKISHCYFVTKIVTNPEVYARIRQEKGVEGSKMFLVKDALSDANG